LQCTVLRRMFPFVLLSTLRIEMQSPLRALSSGCVLPKVTASVS
jgi:hypothetical protein